MIDRFKNIEISTLIKVFMGEFDYNCYRWSNNDPNKVSKYRDGEIIITSDL